MEKPMLSAPHPSVPAARAALAQAGLPSGEIDAWARALPADASQLSSEVGACGAFWVRSRELLARLPAKAARNAAEAAAAGTILSLARASRGRFLRAHALAVYDALTARRSSFLRVDELCRRAGAAYPGLVPSPQDLETEARAALRDKEGLEIDQGLFLASVLADPTAGMHLCHAMLLPREGARERLAELERAGEIDLGAARLERRGKASVVTLKNPRFLNAEDDSTLEATELAVDLALLDTKTEVCVLRGGMVEPPKRAGRRVFGAGINLTRLYQGRIPFLWYLVRDLGFVNKLYRGLALPDDSPEENSIEKPWVAAVEAFAIGGHCQILLAVDCVLAAADAYLTLPARKEGIVPGAANLRLPRFVGERIARQAVMAERRIDCASPEGSLICDAVVRPDEMDAAIERTIERLTGSGVVSAAGNRRAFRAGEEPLDAFRRYMSVYAREQAHCHFSPALVANLERNWNATNRVA
jgi:thioesterase DpgC